MRRPPRRHDAASTWATSASTAASTGVVWVTVTSAFAGASSPLSRDRRSLVRMMPLSASAWMLHATLDDAPSPRRGAGLDHLVGGVALPRPPLHRLVEGDVLPFPVLVDGGGEAGLQGGVAAAVEGGDADAVAVAQLGDGGAGRPVGEDAFAFDEPVLRGLAVVLLAD